MKILDREIKAFIFDLDGTLIDSGYVWTKIDTEFFARRGRKIPKTYVEDIAHMGLNEAANITKQKYDVKESIEEIIQEWQDGAYYEYAFNITLKDGVLEFIKILKDNNIKIALATASPSRLYVPCLKRLGIYDCFDFIADVDDVKVGKNNVALYHLVSKKLDVEPKNTAICEDISVALKTAYMNEYFAIAVYDKHSESDDENKRKYSHVYVRSFMELVK